MSYRVCWLRRNTHPGHVDAIDAFERYYDEQVVMQENALPPTVGKVANRQRELNFFGNVTDLRTMRVLDVAVGENVSAAC